MSNRESPGRGRRGADRGSAGQKASGIRGRGRKTPRTRRSAEGEQPQADIETALRDSEARLRAILDSASDAIIVTDAAGTILSANPAAEGMFGHPESELLGRNINTLLIDAFRERRQADLRELTQNRAKPVVEEARETTGRRRDGRTFPVELTLSAFHYGTPTFTSIIRDITARHNLRRALADAAVQEQRAIARELHDGLAQDLTAALMVATALHERLERAGVAETMATAQLKASIEKGIDHVRLLIRGTYRQLVAAAKFADSLGELADEVRTLRGLRCTLTAPNHRVTSDDMVATQIFYIAREAVNNAARHAQAKHIQIRLEANQRTLVLAVEDDGMGIDPHRIGSGMGTQIMGYRAGLIGAILDIRRATAGGTLVMCTLPREERPDDG